jgi:pimeloyl-ACP methyl ester carboxylesterase
VAVVLAAASCGTDSGVSTVEINSIRPADGPDTTVGDPATPTAIDWSPCVGGPATGLELECGSLTVPLDHARPDGPSVELALARSATPDDDEKIGSLVFNPGGPGGSGIEFLQSAVLLMPPEISSRFDLVAFDPRGVGSSTSVDCDTEFDDEITLVAEGDDLAWDEAVAEAEARPSRCTPETVELGPWFGTNSTARDLDSIREALGDDRLSYVGFSYGTRIGATYAELFPDRVRALVLDGAVKPTTDFAELDAEQAASLDRAFERFAAACDDDADCALSTVGPTLQVYSDLVDTLAVAGGIPTDDPSRVLTPGELEIAVIAAMYNTRLWSVLADGLSAATVDSDGTLLQVLTDTYLGRRPDGSYDQSQDAGFTINCADNSIRPPTEVVRLESEDAARQSRWFGDLLRASTGCIGGPLPVDPLIVGPASDAPPILVIGNTGDPATPYEWSVEMAELLVSAELYTVETDGHTAFLSVPCVEPVVVDYLVDLTMPEPGSSCVNAADDDVFPPPGEGEFDQLVALFECLRENGADIPEVTVADLLADPSGNVLLEAIDPTDPGFGLAVLACEDLIPGS